jgi:hypothetical protein
MFSYFVIRYWLLVIRCNPISYIYSLISNYLVSKLFEVVIEVHIGQFGPLLRG